MLSASLNKIFPSFIHSNQCSTTGVLPCLWDSAYRDPLLLVGKSSHEVAAAGFLSHYLSGSLYVLRHITKYNVLSVSLHETLYSSLHFAVVKIISMGDNIFWIHSPHKMYC